MPKNRLFLKVHTREGLIFNEEIESVSSTNDTGDFDVLPQHSRFISKIKQSIKIKKLNGTEQVIPVGDAIMRVKDKNVEVFLGVRTS